MIVEAFHYVLIVTTYSRKLYEAHRHPHSSFAGANRLSVQEPQIFPSGDDTDSVGVSLATTPSLDTDDLVILPQNTKLHGILDAPYETTINILLPILFVEIGLLLRIEEWIDTAVEMRILSAISKLMI